MLKINEIGKLIIRLEKSGIYWHVGVPGRKQANVSVRMALNFLQRLALQEKKHLMTARVSMLLKSLASLTCFRACFLPGRAKDLSAGR